MTEGRQVSDTTDEAFTAEERARRKAIVTAMLADRDRRRPITVEEILQFRDEGRREVAVVVDASVAVAWCLPLEHSREGRPP